MGDVVAAAFFGFLALAGLLFYTGIAFVGLGCLVSYEQFVMRDDPSFFRKVFALAVILVGLVMLFLNGPSAYQHFLSH